MSLMSTDGLVIVKGLLPEEIHTRIKIIAASEKVTFAKVMERFLLAGIEKWEKSNAKKA